MDTVKYIALDVHLACIVFLVMSATGRVLLKDVIGILRMMRLSAATWFL